MSNSILTKPITKTVSPVSAEVKATWDVNRFNALIDAHGYDALIDRAMRCPCVDKATGQALSTCKNCLGRGWFFIDRKQTRLIAQNMNNKKQYQNWGEVNRGTASITTRGSDKLGFMDRIILIELEAFYSEVINPIYFSNKIIAYPVYEPLQITNMYLFSDDNTKLVPIEKESYKIVGNKIEFNLGIQDLIEINVINQLSDVPISISVRYSHYPVYHVIDMNRELMKVRSKDGCNYSDNVLKDMPINILARKAHYIFDAQKFGEESFENTIL